MKKPFLKIYALFLLLFNIALFSDSWHQVKSNQGINVWKKSSPDSSLLEFKAVAMIDSSLVKILSIIINVTEYPEWVPRNQSGRLISQATKKQMIVYESSAGTWPVEDRDFVADVNITDNKTDKTITILVKNVEKEQSLKLVPAIKGKTRMNEVSSKWTLKAAGKNKTHVTLQVFADPSGGLPKWLVNMVSVDVPYDLLKNIRIRVNQAPSPALATIIETYQEYADWN